MPGSSQTNLTLSGGLDFTMGNYLDKHSRSLRRHERRPSLTRTPPRQSWGRGPSPLGVAANPGPSVDVSFTASCAAPTGRVPGLRGASSSPVHRALVLVLGTNIAVLLDCSKSSRQCSLPYLLTYLGDQGRPGRCGRRACVAGAPKHRQRFLSVRPGGWCRTPVNSSGTGVIRAL